MSHNFNHDPEVRELRETFGDWMALAWEELLSIGDQNEGEVKGNLNQIARLMASISLSLRVDKSMIKTRLALDWMANKGWIEVERDLIRVCKHLKYHILRDDKKLPVGSSTASLPSYLTYPSGPKDAGTPSARPVDNSKKPGDPAKKDAPSAGPVIGHDENPGEKPALDPKVPELIARIVLTDRERFKRLPAWPNFALKHRLTMGMILAALTAFEEALQKGLVIGDWWPYLEKVSETVRSTMLQSESSKYKDAGDLRHVKSVLKGLMG